MAEHDLLVLGLDGFDIGLAEPMIESGELPALRELRDRSRHFLLDHGPATRTGLAWEHFASGWTPERAGRASMVDFESTAYDTRQVGTHLTPFFASFDRVVVFDPPYTDISRAPGVGGVVSWGAHDPGVDPITSPPDLWSELDERFGPYPAGKWTYASPWSSASLTQAMGQGLVDGVTVRRQAARWLLTERFPEWDLAIVVTGEPHSAAEAFWHGVDPAHPLHGIPSAAVAARGLADTYRAVDELVGELIAATSPRVVVAFSMGGMGTNNSDAPSMGLLPELVYRWATGQTLLDIPREWADDATGVPILRDGETWETAVSQCFPARPRSTSTRLKARIPSGVRSKLRPLVGTRPRPSSAPMSLDWQPASRYHDYWPTMRAFALPSFYDGRIRLNLKGREASGLVDQAQYDDVCDELEQVLRQCRDPRTGEPAVDQVERPAKADPLALDAADADLLVTWNGPSCAFEHPTLGTIGPLPFRRTGGHTGPYGFAYIAGEGIEAGDGGVRSSFDVTPTVAALLDRVPAVDIDGTSLVPVAADDSRGSR
jgi:predicted AlkP superfamily phosphohydrolase/phosphomutase